MVLKGFFANINMKPKIKVNGYEGHIKMICKKAYSRMSLVTKLIKFGASVPDLVRIYIIFMRSVLEYCAVRLLT